MRRSIGAFVALGLAASQHQQTKAFAPSTTNVAATSTPTSCRKRSRWQLQASLTKELSTLTVIELKDLLREQGCKVSGRKAELVQRLEQAFIVDTGPKSTANGEGVVDSTNPPARAKRPAVAERKLKLKSTTEKAIVTEATLDAEFDSVFGSTIVEKAAMPIRTQTTEVLDGPRGSDALIPSSKSEAKVATKNIGFSDFNIPKPVLRQISKMGIENPTPIQREAIPKALEGIDVMGLAQTGTGKTLAFGCPLISKLLDGGEHDARGKNALKPRGVSALVLAPTRELANQIADQLRALTEGTPVNTFVVYGGVRVSTQANRLKNGVHILVATPGRLIDLEEQGALSLRDTKFLVLDEGDHMLDMGFAPSLKKIVGKLPSKRQTMIFSATMSKGMAEVAKLYLNNPVRVEVARSGKTADKITQELHYLTKMDKMTKLLSLMKKHEGERTLVFGRTKHGIQKLCNRLQHAGIKATSIHGNKSQPQRDRALREFKSGQMTVLVATDVAARGLDIPEVKHVYNYELPDQAENYVHRIGRTARAGNDGSSISFCSPEEMSALTDIEKVIEMQIPVVSGTPWGSPRPSKGTVKKPKRNRPGKSGGRRQAASENESTRRVFRKTNSRRG